jgi:hypothetical protein
MRAREVVAPQYNPAPFGGRMSEGQEGGFAKNATFAKGFEFTEYYCRQGGI